MTFNVFSRPSCSSAPSITAASSFRCGTARKILSTSLLALLLLGALVFPLGAQEKTAAPGTGSVPEFRVVASTSWTAAFARAAGARDIVTMAPSDLRHPPEYELKTSDLAAVSGARFLVHSGYERFAKRLAETAGDEGLTVLQVYTDNIPSTFMTEAGKLAAAFGTMPAWKAWASSFDTFTKGVRTRIASALPGVRVVAHRYLKTYVEWLGLEVVGTFGPGEPTPALLLDIAKSRPTLIVDNYHNPSAKAVAEATGVPVVTLINFPGKDGTRTIEDVFLANERAFLAAANHHGHK